MVRQTIRQKFASQLATYPRAARVAPDLSGTRLVDQIVRQKNVPDGLARPKTYLRCRSWARFWWKTSTSSTKSEGKADGFGHGNAREGRSTSFASNPWIKTYQNSQKSQIEPKEIWSYFFVEFSKLAKSKKNLGELGGNKGKIRGNLEL